MIDEQDAVLTVEATVVHVEDEPDWREEVQRQIEQIREIRFRRFISRASLEEANEELRSVAGPVILLMDLRLEGQSVNLEGQNVNYGGYHWLLEDLRDLLARNASTVVFVISGQLNEAVRETLLRQEIPESHIYDKGRWPGQRSRFLDTLRLAVQNMDRIAEANIARGASGANIDPYLIHTLRVREEARTRRIGEVGPAPGEVALPMVIRTKTETWAHEAIPDLQVLGRIGNIYSCRGSLRSITFLERDPEVLKVEASRPATGPEGVVAPPPSQPAVEPPSDPSPAVEPPPHEEKGDAALIAFIDTGIDVLHEAFRDASGNRTRIWAIWDQRDPTGPPPPGFTVGTHHTRDQINQYIADNWVPESLRTEPQDHGTHVASIAAGRPTGSFAGGVAPAAKLLVVISDLQTAPDRPHSLGYSDSHLLALEYIQRFATQENSPVVINISQGMNSGAHDGTSNVECGVDLIMKNGKAPGIVVVKSAGNERNHHGHAKLRMVSYAGEVLHWNSNTTSRWQDVIELWYNALDQYSFRLMDPKGQTTPWIDLSNPATQGTFPSGNGYQLNLKLYDPDNGDNRLLITISPGVLMTIMAGLWSLQIESKLVRIGDLHTWIERDDARPVSFTNHLDEEVTLSIPGTAKNIITVGSSQSPIPLALSDFSSQGPTRDKRSKPDLVTLGEEIKGADSNSLNGVVLMSGTSMAAPQVSGAIALLLSRQVKAGVEVFNASQVRAILTKSCHPYMGDWHPGFGFGHLDVKALVNMLLNLYPLEIFHNRAGATDEWSPSLQPGRVGRNPRRA